MTSLLRSLADAFHEGGWPMWPLTLLLFASWGLSIAHAIAPGRRLFIASLVLLISSLVLGGLGTLLGLLHTFAAVANTNPSMKAALLAKGISEAMNCSAFGLIILLVGAVPLIIGERRRRL